MGAGLTHQLDKKQCISLAGEAFSEELWDHYSIEGFISLVSLKRLIDFKRKVDGEIIGDSYEGLNSRSIITIIF
jgi:hypothetical protein